MEGHHQQPDYSCKSCDRRDTSEEHMLICDQCKLYEHITCASVSETTPGQPFVCKLCQEKAKGSTISSRLRSHAKRVLSNKASDGKPASNIGSKVSSGHTSTRSSVVRALGLQLIEEEEKLKQKELEEEEALKELEHKEAQLQLEQKRKQMEEQKKLMEEESLLRQRKLEANKARMMKQQLIRRESLEKKNEILLQISERGSIVESTKNSREKVSDWLRKLLPHEPTGEKTSDNHNDHQSEQVPPAANEVSSMIVEVPINGVPVLNTPSHQLNFQAANPQGLPDVNLVSRLYSRTRLTGVHSATVRQPFEQFVACSRPTVPQPTAALSRPQVINQAFRPYEDERSSIRPTNYQHGPPWSTSIRYVATPHLQPATQMPTVVHHEHSGPVLENRPMEVPNRGPTLINVERENPLQNELPGILNSQQIAARQVVGKDLPHFSGDPSDWPMFISSFEQSTIACGYSNAENLVRLQRCLTGHARESVRSRLLLPANVPRVVSTLRTLYGRPELLIRSMLDKIRRTPGPKHDRPESILEFGLAVQNFVDHLQAAEQEEHLSNPMLMQELVEKLPGPMRMDWASFKSRQPRATVSTFGEFMSKLVTAASEVSFELPGLTKDRDVDKPQRLREKARIQAHSTDDNPSLAQETESTRKPQKVCRFCDRDGHRVADCSRFKQLSLEERWKQVQDKELCRTCLNAHGKWPCKSWKGCGFEGCRLKHHTLLHSSSVPATSTHPVNVSANNLPARDSHTLFRILPVVLYANGKIATIFAFIDEGSQITMIEEKVAKELGVTGPRKPLTLQWTGNVTRNELQSQEISMEIAGENDENRYELRHARTVSRLLLPAQRLNYTEMTSCYPHLKGLPIASYNLVQPKLLIGLDNLRLGVPLKVREGGSTDPIAAKCRLGWSIYGRASKNPVPRAIVSFHTAAASSPDDLLNEQLRDFFTLENNGSATSYEKLESDEDKRSRQLLEETTRRTADGFETGLLWKVDDPQFPNTYPMAVRRMKSLEKKLLGNQSLAQRVNEQILDFEQKGYIRKLTELESSAIDPRKTWFLPLGVVINSKKPGKIRLIWDAAAKTGEVSFNSFLLKGPDLLTPLPRVLSGFRLFPVAVSGDIREMFLQIKLQAKDKNAQMFVFRHNPDEPIQVYAIDVTMFGSTCSPSSAQFVKNLNAEQYALQYPRAAAAIKEHHWTASEPSRKQCRQ